MLPQILVFLFGYFIQLVAADTLFGLLTPHGLIRTTNSRVYGRQAPTPAPNVPAQCKADCDPILARVAQSTPQGCSPADCCQSAFVTGYFNCLKCVGTAENITDYNPAQEVLDELVVSCTGAGFNVPKLTLPGIDPNRPLPSSVAPLPSGNPPPSASNQQTLTGLPTITPATAASGSAPASTSASSPSSAISHHFFTPKFSHLSAYVASLVVLVHFIG